MPPGCREHVGPAAVVLLLPEEIADAAVDGLADLLGGDFRPRRPYNRPKQPNTRASEAASGRFMRGFPQRGAEETPKTGS